MGENSNEDHDMLITQLIMKSMHMSKKINEFWWVMFWVIITSIIILIILSISNLHHSENQTFLRSYLDISTIYRDLSYTFVRWKNDHIRSTRGLSITINWRVTIIHGIIGKTFFNNTTLQLRQERLTCFLNDKLIYQITKVNE